MATPLPPDFDAHSQVFTLIASDGTPFNTSMADIEYLRQYSTRIAINWGTQIGASAILLLILLLLTRREKRKSSIFALNCFCLILNTIRSILQCRWVTSEWFHPYSVLAPDYSRITPSDRANTIASNTILLLLIIAIMISLSLQVWVVCVTAKPPQRAIIMGTTTLVACVAVGYRFALSAISNVQSMRDLGMASYRRLTIDTNIAQAVAVWYYCSVFTFKLGHALVQRKRMRMTQFGPMQIIFIMGCQTMIIPAIFTTLQLCKEVPELSSQSATIICIFLPLSAIWAGLVSTDTQVGASGAGCHQVLLRDQFSNSSQKGAGMNSRFSGTPGKGSISTYASCGKGPESPKSPITPSGKNYSRSDAIYVGKDYTVEDNGVNDEWKPPT